MPTVYQLTHSNRRMPTKRYLDYLRSPQWARVRLSHLKRCDWTCEICNRSRARQVHHLTYDRLGHEWPDDLAAVCFACHYKLHAKLVPQPANDNQLELPLLETG